MRFRSLVRVIMNPVALARLFAKAVVWGMGAKIGEFIVVLTVEGVKKIVWT